MSTACRPTPHRPIDSPLLAGLEVVEERHDGVRLFPHTEQLPVLAKALRWEFHNGLPGRVARADHRADGFTKIWRRVAAYVFCCGYNAARADGVRLFPLVDYDQVAHAAIVQQISFATPQGRLHRFRFYVTDQFVPEIYLSGHPVLFTEHALERFRQRVPTIAGSDLATLLWTFFSRVHLVMKAGPGPVLIVRYEDTILAFGYKLTETALVVTTCLSIHELPSLEPTAPTLVGHPHYAGGYAPPRVRHWSPISTSHKYHQFWQHKRPLTPMVPLPKVRWTQIAPVLNYLLGNMGHGPGSEVRFLDDIPGPVLLELKPGEPVPQVDERAQLKELVPDVDWEAIFDEINPVDGGEQTPAPVPQAA